MDIVFWNVMPCSLKLWKIWIKSCLALQGYWGHFQRAGYIHRHDGFKSGKKKSVCFGCICAEQLQTVPRDW